MNSNGRYSIRTQLLRWLLIPILVLLGLSIGSNYYLSRSFINTAYDDGLEELAWMLAGQVETEDGHFELASPALTKKIMEQQTVDGLAYLILGPQNEFIAGDRRLGFPAKDKQSPQYRNITMDGHSIRVVTIYIPFGTSQQPRWVSVQLGETLEDRGDLIGKIQVTTVAHQLVLILLAAACVWLGVTRGLQPLSRISQAIQSRSAADLNSLNLDQTPDEVQPLISAINDLLTRIQSYLAMQRRFVANAAHQLRTPIAGLQTQAELLTRQTLPETAQHHLSQMQTGLSHSSHLLHQLLSLSRAEPDALQMAQFKPVNLTQLVSQVAESFVPIALQKQIDFGIETREKPNSVLGDQGSLYDLVSNLIDNALLYTSAGGRVTVRLEEDTHDSHSKLILSVEDNGPGIPEAERQKAFERFYRVPGQAGNGSGLGLAIVQEIAQTHHAQVRIEEAPQGSGTVFKVLFQPLGSGPAQ